MSSIKIYTIGVYGSTKESFFNALTKNDVDTFCDIRKRRGVRGVEYTYANSRKLRDNLEDLCIRYLHIPELSPTDEMRKRQYSIDKEMGLSQRRRERLSKEFISSYKKEILSKFNFKAFIKQLEETGSKKIVLFCVEQKPSACHRWLVAEFLNVKYKFSIQHL